MFLLSSNKIQNLTLVVVLLVCAVSVLVMIHIDRLAVGVSGAGTSNPRSLTALPNLHAPVFQSQTTRQLTILVVPGISNDSLPLLKPFQKRIEQRLKADDKTRERLPGFYRGSFKGSELADELLFKFATGYSFDKLFFGPLSLRLSSGSQAGGGSETGNEPNGKPRASFLSGTTMAGYRVSLCAPQAVQELFPETGIKREVSDTDGDFLSEAPDVLRSSYRAHSRGKMVHVMTLSPDAKPSDTVLASLFDVALSHTERTGGLLLVIGFQYGTRPGRIVDHDFFFYGSGVLHKEFEQSYELSLSDIVSTVSCQLRVPQPSTCLGWPLVDLMNVYRGRRRLWLSSQITQENSRIVPMVVARFYGRERYKSRPVEKVKVYTGDDESEYLAVRQASFGRSSRNKLIAKEMEKYSGLNRSANVLLFDWVFFWSFVLVALVLVLVVLFFGPSPWAVLFYGSFLHLWFTVFAEYYHEKSPQLHYSLMSGTLFCEEMVVLFVLPVFLWCLAGIRYQWNGRNSVKAFIVVGACSILVEPVNHFTRLFVTTNGVELPVPLTYEYPLWLYRVYSSGLLLFLGSSIVFPIIFSLVLRMLKKIFRMPKKDPQNLTE